MKKSLNILVVLKMAIEKKGIKEKYTLSKKTYTEEEKNNDCDLESFSWEVDDFSNTEIKKLYQYNPDNKKFEEYDPNYLTNPHKHKINFQRQSQNPLLEFKLNCFERGHVPFGMVDKVQNNQSTKNWLRDFFNIDEFLAKKMTEGGECIVSGNGSPEDRQKVDFALYLMDQKTQDILDGSNL